MNSFSEIKIFFLAPQFYLAKSCGFYLGLTTEFHRDVNGDNETQCEWIEKAEVP